MDQNRLDIRLLKGLGQRQEEISHWLNDNRRGLLVGAALFILLIILVLSLLFQGKEDWSHARSEVEKELQKMERLDIGGHEELLSLAKSIEDHLKASSEFVPLYQGRLAQALILNGGVEEASKLLAEQENRIQAELPLPFKLFSESSLWIAKGEFEKAWEMEALLKEEIDLSYGEKTGEAWVDTFFAYNLVRRALLAHLLDKNTEASALKMEIASLLEQKDGSFSRRQALENLVEAYRIGPKTILSYLQMQDSSAAGL